MEKNFTNSAQLTNLKERFLTFYAQFTEIKGTRSILSLPQNIQVM